MKRIAIITLSIIVIACEQKEPLHEEISNEFTQNWHFENFEKVDSINPILKPSPELEFIDPITKSSVKWEERNVLNPTALIKNDTVYLLYRAQDINGTSRIGMATSTDGLHFTKQPAPIFYPDNDDMKVNEWNYKKSEAEQVNSEECYFCYFDGVEDPRIVMNES